MRPLGCTQHLLFWDFFLDKGINQISVQFPLNIQNIEFSSFHLHKSRRYCRKIEFSRGHSLKSQIAQVLIFQEPVSVLCSSSTNSDVASLHGAI